MYSRLFKLPKFSWIMALGFSFSALASFLLFSVFSPSSAGPLYQLTFFGDFLSGLIAFFGAFIISSGLSDRIFKRRKSKIMNLRRTLGVSLFSLAFTCAVFLIGWILYFVFSIPLLVDFFIFALAAGFTVRLLVDLVIAGGHFLVSIGDSISQPLLESILFLGLFGVPWFLSFLLLVLAVAGVFAAFTIVYVKIVGSQLKESTGVDGRAFFSSFLSEWSAGIGEELERIIDKNSSEKDLRISAFSFRSNKGKMKATLIVPSIHPGPFKGIGSSDLPGYLMRRLERDFSCPAICAHGPSTHGENLVRSRQCENIYRKTLEILERCRTYRDSSPVLRMSEAGISVACQIFGGSALLVSSSSPSLPTDDISFDVGESAIAAAQKSVKEAFFVDSHSCIDPGSDYVWSGSRISKLLVKMSQGAAEKASKLDRLPFKIGVAKIRSTGISKVEGMGEEGVSALVVQVAGRRNVYLFFDSNNLVFDLRRILTDQLVRAGFDEVEVLTSDTHSTSALTPGKMGYNPLGLLTPRDKIVSAAISVVNLALENLEDASVCIGSQVVKGIRVAGEENMQNILKGVRNSLRVAKKLAPVSFGLATVLSAILVFLFSL
jgi:predicted neutral ceramidase superfamily lipid hydrolase